MALDGGDLEVWAANLGLGDDASDFMRTLPGEVQARVMEKFNPEGTKDGDVVGRLKGFANSILRRVSGDGGGAPPQWPPASRRATPVATPRGASHMAALHQGAWRGSSHSSRVAQYAQTLGLDEFGLSCLESWPEDVRATVMQEFDPRGTKDGHVFGRLLNFARVIWVQRLGLEGPPKQEAQAILRQLSEEAQAKVIAQFDVSGTKDGNVLARLQRFAQGVASRLGAAEAPAPRWQQHGYGGGGLMAHGSFPAAGLRGGGCSPMTAGGRGGYPAAPCRSGGWASPGGAGLPAARAPPRLGGPRAGGAFGGGRPASSLGAFARRNGLAPAQIDFMQSLPPEVLQTVLQDFDPSGTKDGNVWGRLFGFIRSVWTQWLCVDHPTHDYLKSLSADVQEVVMSKFDPSTTKDGNLSARLQSFARSVADRTPAVQRGASGRGGWNTGGAGATFRPGLGGAVSSTARPGGGAAGPVDTIEDFISKWRLDADAVSFLNAMPDTVLRVVMRNFNPANSMDGNVWGRLFGFVRSVWSQTLGVDKETFMAMRGLPEESQLSIMLNFDEGTPAETIIERIQDEASALEDGGGAFGGRRAHEDEDGAMSEFVIRCGLGDDSDRVVALLKRLDPEARSVVMSDFDPGGSQDGNVFGRLTGFANAVEKKRRPHGAGGGYARNVKPRRF